MRQNQNLLRYIFIACVISGCKPDIKKDINYLVDNGNYDIYPDRVMFETGCLGDIDRVKRKIEASKPSGFSLDVYPLQFGPEPNIGIGEMDICLGDTNIHGWSLGFLTQYSFIEKLIISSVCDFTFEIDSDNRLKHLEISSHSCGLVSASEPINFERLEQLKSLHISRYVFSSDESKGLSEIKTLESLTANDCVIDLKELLGLKKQLRYLNLSYSEVHNWHLLSEFTNLEVLYIAGITNVILGNDENTKFLKELHRLKELSLKRNSISDLNCVKALSNLERLYIQKTEVKEIPNFLRENKRVRIIE